ncbi:neuronal-specific septin-3-like isoform X3 [Lethenteron reissneri]|uniref:neuronal-specific septin-3-like isoform X3 n=1 Tax=Lethenteron reissneri TaxID=7753 RepID=UPI002AB7B4DD|nr:neuronal-specific septin-3-like isoform X3 [Lethenteron reissneri]
MSGAQSASSPFCRSKSFCFGVSLSVRILSHVPADSSTLSAGVISFGSQSQAMSEREGGGELTPRATRNGFGSTELPSGPPRATEPPGGDGGVAPGEPALLPRPPWKGIGVELFGYVGIDAVLEQMRRKAMKQGLEFNVMIVGQSGLGKSTLVNTLFKSRVSRKSCTPNYQEKILKTVEIQSVSHVIEEKGVKMKLTVIDTPGFGDQINNENCWEPILKYIGEQYEKYLREEVRITRKRHIPDTRVHCCIYCIPPSGHSLRPLDVEFMQHLSKVVSVVPVITKADTLTLEERHLFRQRIQADLVAHGIDVYPQCEFDEDEQGRLENAEVREKIPFAVVGSDREYQENGRRVLGRKTRWGLVEVENINHCEFALLRDLLIRSHMEDLKDVTHSILYETYRVRRLNETNGMAAWKSPSNGHREKDGGDLAESSI